VFLPWKKNEISGDRAISYRGPGNCERNHALFSTSEKVTVLAKVQGMCPLYTHPVTGNNTLLQV